MLCAAAGAGKQLVAGFLPGHLQGNTQHRGGQLKPAYACKQRHPFCIRDSEHVDKRSAIGMLV